MGFFQSVTDALGYWSASLVYGILVMAGVFGLILLRSSLHLILTTLVLVAATGIVLWWLGYLPLAWVSLLLW